MIEFNVNGKTVEAKYNFQAMFRANKLFSSQEGAGDGASNVWVGLVTGDDMALYKAIRVLLPDGYTDEHVYEILDEADEAGKLDELQAQVEEELHKSGFFRRAATRWVHFLEKYGELDKKAKTNEEKLQKEAQADTLAAMKKSLS